MPGPPLPDKFKKKLNSLPLMLTTTRVLLSTTKPSRKTIRSKRKWRPRKIADSQHPVLKIPSATTLSFRNLMMQQFPQNPHNKRIRNGRVIITPCNSRNKTKTLPEETRFLLTLGAHRHQRKQMRCLLGQMLRCATVVTTGLPCGTSTEPQFPDSTTAWIRRNER